jgi:hypothetical protein
MLFVLAFAEWPIERELRSFRQQNQVAWYHIHRDRSWVIRLFTFGTILCVYRFTSYRQNSISIGPTAPDMKWRLLLPGHCFTISLPVRRIGQRRRATRAPYRCYTAERLWGLSEPFAYLPLALMR